MNETLELVKALMSSSQLTNAKLEALAMDVHRISGDITGMKVDMNRIAKNDRASHGFGKKCKINLARNFKNMRINSFILQLIRMKVRLCNSLALTICYLIRRRNVGCF
jgi:hypothetical protein